MNMANKIIERMRYMSIYKKISFAKTSLVICGNFSGSVTANGPISAGKTPPKFAIVQANPVAVFLSPKTKTKLFLVEKLRMKHNS